MIRRTCAAAAVLLALASCSRSPADHPNANQRTPATTTPASTAAATSRPPARAGNPAVTLPRPNDVDRSSPDAVAAAALTTLYSYDTTHDRGPADAALRALPWLSPDFAQVVRTAPPIAPADATWTTWARHQAAVVPRLTPGHDDRPADTAFVAYRQYAIELTPHGSNGWQEPPRRSVVFVHLARSGSAWAVDQVLPR